MSELEALIRFAKSRHESGPAKLHHGVRSIRAGRSGFTAEAAAWLFGSDAVTVRQTSTSPCTHSYSADLGGCAWCGVHGPDGRIITHKGERTTTSVVYRFPYKAALAKLSRLPVPDGYPRLHEVVRLLVGAGAMWRAQMVERWPALVSEEKAAQHAAVALRRFRSVYSEAPPQRWPR